MREQVIVLPPSVERKKTSFNLSTKEEALLNASKESRDWAVSAQESTEQIRRIRLIGRDHEKAMPPALTSAERMMQDDAKQASAEPYTGACVDERPGKARDEEGRLAAEGMRNSPSSNGEGTQLLQWGQGKRPRGTRADTHNLGSRMSNHNLMPGSVADESSLLYHTTVRGQANTASAARPSTNSHTSEENLKTKNGIIAEREHSCSEENQNQQVTVLQGCPSDVKQGTKGLPSRAGKRGYPHKEDQLLQESKTCAAAEPNLPPKYQRVTPLPGSKDAPASKNEPVWPKFDLQLSRKEKQEDFLIFKGTKLPHRPKRRPKVVEKALHYCSPGSWLGDISPSRYEVREKSRVRKKSKGLKAMESLDSDSD